MNSLKALWKGDVSLAKTFWGLFYLGNLAFIAIESSVVDSGGGDSIEYIILILIGLAYFVFTAVAVVKSANSYTKETNKVWGKMAVGYVFLSVLGIIYTGTLGFREGLQETSMTIEQELRIAVDELNKQLPMMMDDGTELFKASANRKSITYNYKVIDYFAYEVDSIEFYKIMYPEVCEHEKMNSLIEAGGNVIYTYHGKNMATIAELTFDKDDCSGHQTPKK